MTFTPGQPRPENAGRQRGTPNGRSSLKAFMKLAERGVDPLDILMDIAEGKKMRCGVGLNKAGDDLIEDDVLPTLDQRMSAAKELAQYVYPKRKAVDAAIEVSVRKVEKVEDLPGAIGDLMNAVVAGEIAPTEGQQIAGMLEVLRKSIEIVEIDRRLAALEARHGTAT